MKTGRGRRSKKIADRDHKKKDERTGEGRKRK